MHWLKVPVSVAVDIDPAACQIDPDIRPLHPPGKQPRLFGRAFTVQCDPPDFGSVLRGCEMIKPGDVMVIAAGGNRDTAVVGEIVSGHMRRLGGVGVICDGAIRDVDQIATWNDFSVFTRHITPRGPVSYEHGTINETVTFGGIDISPGDLIIGDDDGLARLTPQLVADFIEAAEEKMRLEKQWESRLANGNSVKETFGL